MTYKAVSEHHLICCKLFIHNELGNDQKYLCGAIHAWNVTKEPSRPKTTEVSSAGIREVVEYRAKNPHFEIIYFWSPTPTWNQYDLVRLCLHFINPFKIQHLLCARCLTMHGGYSREQNTDKACLKPVATGILTAPVAQGYYGIPYQG